MITTTTLRRSGGSHIVTLPAAFVEKAGLLPGARLEMFIEGSSLVLRPAAQRPRLADLIAQCDPRARYPDDRDWLDVPPAGRELL